MSPADVSDTLDNVCFAPGIRWDAESLAQFFGCRVDKIGAIPGVLRENAKSSDGVRSFEFEHAYLCTVQVANWMGKSRTTIARLNRHGVLNSYRGPNDSALFLVQEVNELNGWPATEDDAMGKAAQNGAFTKTDPENQSKQPGMATDDTRPEKATLASLQTRKERMRALLIEDLRLFEQLQGLSLDHSVRDQWEQFIAVRRAAVSVDAD